MREMGGMYALASFILIASIGIVSLIGIVITFIQLFRRLK